MTKHLFTRLLQASLMCCMAVLFTACDEIFGSEDSPVSAYMTFSDKPVTIKVGETFQRQAITASRVVVEYSSSNTAVATVDGAGTVTGVAVGEATITATVSGKNVEGKRTFLPDQKSYVVTVKAAAPSAKITTAPTATASVKAGSSTALVIAGVADGGTMMYAVTTVNTKPTATDGFSATIPTAATLAAGTYYVWYYAKADATHTDSNISATAVEVTVTKILTMLETPLTFEAKTAGAVVTFKASNDAIEKTVEYSTDGGATWTEGSTNKTAGGISVTLTNAGDKVMFRGTNDCYGTSTNYNHFTCSADCYVYGNVMSLINKDNYATNKELTATHAFRDLFGNNDKIFSHDTKTLELPATTLTSNCYRFMFYGCKKMTKSPALPATTLADYCYYYMFNHCEALTTAPALPAETLAEYCYQYMFGSCTALATAPALPATEMKNGCYSFMFSHCSGLTTAPNLPATTLANSCYYRMFEFCTGLTTTQEELPVTTLKEACYKFMFEGCTALTKAPKLPATTLVKECYWGMFNGCTSLNEAWVAADYTITYPIKDACWNIFTGCYNGTSPKGTLHTATTSNAWTAGTHMPANWLISKDYNPAP